MHPLAIFVLLFASIVFAVPNPAATPSALPASNIPRVLKPVTPPTATDVQNSVVNWATSVNTVNAYLNDPQNLTKLTNAIVFAADEPVQLATLMKVTGLSAAGANSGKVLMGNFPSIVSNLNLVRSGAMSTADGTSAVNFNRCCTVLPAISSLWAAAQTASKTAVSAPPNMENQCALMSCVSGVSGVSANKTISVATR